MAERPVSADDVKGILAGRESGVCAWCEQEDQIADLLDRHHHLVQGIEAEIERYRAEAERYRAQAAGRGQTSPGANGAELVADRLQGLLEGNDGS